jgi:toxin ParE1/3/4
VRRRIAWSVRAAADYHAQLEYIAEQDPFNADAVDQRIMAAIEKLAESPMGRPGRVAGTYEKTIVKTGLVVAYALGEGSITIIRIIHARRNWLPGEWPQDEDTTR